MSRIIPYWPDVIAKIKDFQIVATAEDPELSGLWGAVDDLVADQYIQSATDKGLRKYEHALGIRPRADDSLEERRFRALIEWADSAPYTWRTLLSRLDALSGPGNYLVTLNAPACILNVITCFGVPGAVTEAYKVLDKITPINLQLNHQNILEYTERAGVTCASAAVSGIHYTLTCDLNTKNTLDGPYTIGGSLADGAVYEIN